MKKLPVRCRHALSTGLFSGGGIFMYNNSLSNESIFKYQSEVIRSVSQAGSCIIVGRCADYILQGEEKLFQHIHNRSVGGSCPPHSGKGRCRSG